MISDIIPEGLRLSNDLRDYFSDRARSSSCRYPPKRPTSARKKTRQRYNSEHVISALKKLGFDDFIDEYEKMEIEKDVAKDKRIEKKKKKTWACLLKRQWLCRRRCSPRRKRGWLSISLTSREYISRYIVLYVIK